MTDLIVADKWGKPQPREYAKSPAPAHLGGKFGVWAGRDLSFVNLPGGAALQFDLSRLTLNDFRAMKDHYQINISLTTIMFLMHQLDWSIDCSDKKIGKKIETNLRSQWTPLIRGLCQAHWAGYSPLAVEYDNNPQPGELGIGVRRFKDLVPEECRVHWKYEDGYAAPGHTPPRLYEFDGIQQFGVPPIPVENSLWYPLLMENGDYYGRKLLRAAFQPWFFSVLIHLYANRYFERFGEPLPVGRADFNEELEIGGKMVNGRQAMEGILTNIRNRSVVVLPSDRDVRGDGKSGDYLYDIEYLESQMRGADFERYLSRLDEEMSLAMFTPLLVTRVSEVGSYNLGVGHTQLYLWMLNALAGDFKHYLDHYLIKPLKDWNFGPNAPRAEFTYRSMGKSNAQVLQAVVAQAIRAGDIKPDVEELGTAVGLTFTDVQALTHDKSSVWPPKPGTPGAKPAPGDARPSSSRAGTAKAAVKPGVSNPKTTGRKIAARLANQVSRAFAAGTFGDGFHADLGHRRQMEDALLGEGLDNREAIEAAESLFEKLDNWIDDACVVQYETPEQFVNLFNSVLDQEIEHVLT